MAVALLELSRNRLASWGRASDRRPPILHAVLLVIGAWAVVFELLRFVGLVSSQPANNDYRVFYLAAEAGIRWGWPHMYDPSRLQELNASFALPVSSDISPLYTYLSPPLLAWLIATLVPLPFTVGFCIWAALNAGALGAACRLVFGHSRTVWIAVFLGSLAIWPSALAIERGQPELVLYALVIASWWCADRGHQRSAGLLLGIAGCLKPPAIVLLPAIFLLCGRGRAALWWLVTMVAAAAIFSVVLGPVGIGTYLGVTAWAASDPNFTATPFFSPFGSRTSLLVGQAMFAAAALVGAWINRRSLRRAVAIGIVGSVMSAVHLHEYDYVGLVVAAWLAVDRSPLSVANIAWLSVGVICAQLPAIGIRLPILVWEPLWLLFLTLPVGLTPTVIRIFERTLVKVTARKLQPNLSTSS
jgi:Glycosyltransferase family 87